MVEFTATLHKYGEQGDKTGWTYIEVPADIAEELNPGTRKSYRVKGFLDKHKIDGVSILPLGGGAFILAVNAAMRKGIAKNEGARLIVKLELDTKEYQLNNLLVEGIEASAKAHKVFYTLPRSHQNYYSKWIDSAKLLTTQEKRVVMVVMALERGLSYGEMLREQSAVRKRVR